MGFSIDPLPLSSQPQAGLDEHLADLTDPCGSVNPISSVERRQQIGRLLVDLVIPASGEPLWIGPAFDQSRIEAQRAEDQGTARLVIADGADNFGEWQLGPGLAT